MGGSGPGSKFVESDGRRGYLRKRVGLAAVLGLLCLPAVALATHIVGAGIKPDVRKVLTVRCPPGQHVISVSLSGSVYGAEFTPPVSLEFEHDPAGNVAGVSAEFRNYGPTATNVEVDVICSGGDPKLKTVTRTTTVGPGGGGSVTAICPSGTSVRLGGFKTSFSSSNPGSRVTVDGLERPAPGKWTVSSFNYGGRPGSLEAVAECGTGPKLTPATKTITLPASNAQSSAVAHCPQGKRMLLGGFSAPFSGFGPVFDLLEPTRTTMKAGVYDYAGAAQVHRLTAIAYCG